MTTLASADVVGVFNLRDLGGFETGAGGTTRSGLVHRADGLHRTDAAGRSLLVARGLDTVIDLRTMEELDGDGRFDHPEVTYHHLPIIDTLDPFGDDVDPDANVLLLSYLGWLAENGKAFAAVLEVVAGAVDDERPVVFHCTAGKDRTGLTAALILAAVGLDGDAIAADYARSAAAMPRLREWYTAKAEAGDDSPMQQMRRAMSANQQAIMMGAEPATMLAVLDHLGADRGGVDTYLAEIGAAESMARIKAGLAPSD
ncbi:MAG: tyrosine-protein phosphatase [Actinomycetota bacterium]